MTPEQLAIVGIAIFAFIALVQAFNTVRTIKKTSRKKTTRYRRPIGSEEGARSTARGLVKEVVQGNRELAEEAATTGRIPAQLEAKLEKTQQYYRERVETRYRGLFHEAVNEIILKKGPG